ncbi:right-handed parallel beta-helix repeat-containing protein [Candidatus Zixiibacteriota bacterium]
MTALFFAILFLGLLAYPAWATDHSGTISSSTTWYSADNPHNVVGDVTVQAGATLTLEAGVTVQLDAFRNMTFYGILMAEGVPDTGIVFTRSGASNWGKLYFTGGSSNGTMDYCTIEYGGYVIQPAGDFGGTLSLSYCTIQNSSFGLYAINSPGIVSVSACTLQNNDMGINSLATSVQLSSTMFKNNTSYGFFADWVAPVLMDSNNVFESNGIGIRVKNASSCSLTAGAIVRDNTSGGIQLLSCSNVMVDNMTLTGNGGTYGAIHMEDTGEFVLGSGNMIGGVGQENSWPLVIGAGAYPSAGSLIPTSGNTNNDIRVYSGYSAKSGTWRKFTDLDYIVSSTPTFSSGGDLTIEDGVIVKFDDGQGINMGGNLTAVGAPGTGIGFTRNAGATSWGKLFFTGAGSSGRLDYCTVEHGWYAIQTDGGLADTLSLSNCTIQNSGIGIYVTGSPGIVSVSACTLQNNDTGINALTGRVELSSTTLKDNANYGFYGDYVPPVLLDTNNVFENSGIGIRVKNASGCSLTTGAIVRDNSSCGIQLLSCTDVVVDNMTLTGNGGTYGAFHMEDTGEFVLGSGNTTGGSGQENSWPLTIGAGAYVSASSLIPTSGNNNNDIQVRGGTSAKSGTWHQFTDLDYIVSSTPVFSSGGALTIEDGNTVKLQGLQSINILGTLTAVGTPGNGIVFTRSGATDWSSLNFIDSGSSGRLDYCTVERGGYVIQTQGGFADTLSLSHCTVENNSFGVYAISATGFVSVSACTLQNNDRGIQAIGGALSLKNNTVVDNADYGIYLHSAIDLSLGTQLSEWNDIYDNGGGSDGRQLRNGSLDTYAPYVYWGSVIGSEIEAKIWDKEDDVSLGSVCYAPWSNAAHDQATGLWMTAELENGAKSSSGDMYLEWTEYCGQVSLDHYVVYRSTEAETKGDSLAGTTDNWYLDLGVVGIVDTNYFYTAELVDSLGNRFESNQVGEFDIEIINHTK